MKIILCACQKMLNKTVAADCCVFGSFTQLSSGTEPFSGLPIGLGCVMLYPCFIPCH